MTLASTASPAFRRSRQCAAACRSVAKCPFRWTCTTASHSSSVIETTMRSRRIPALLTSTSSRPQTPTAVSTSDRAPSHVAMDRSCAIASPPAARISRTTTSADSTSLTTTRAPSAAKARACSRPMPRPAPVTATTRPPTPASPVKVQLQHPDRVAPHELVDRLVVEPLHVVLGDGSGLGPGGVDVGVVGFEGGVVDADGVEGGDAVPVTEEAAEDLPVVVRRRRLGYQVLHPAPGPVFLPHVVGPLQRVGDPAHLPL